MAFTPDAPPTPAEAISKEKAGGYKVQPADLNYDATAALPGAELRGKETAAAAKGQYATMPASHFTPDAPPAAPPAYQPDATDIANKGAPTGSDRGPMAPIGDFVDMLRAIPPNLVPALKGMLGNRSWTDPTGGGQALINLYHTVKSFAQDPGGTISAVGSTLRNATPAQVGANVGAPIVVGAGVGELAGLVGSALSPAAMTPARALDLRTTSESPISATAAGNTAGTHLDIHNQGAAQSALKQEVGIPNEQPLNHASLATAAGPPGNILDNAAATVQPAPLSHAAAAIVAKARPPASLLPGNPAVDAYVNQTEAKLATGDPITGEQVRNTRNEASQAAAAGRMSQDPSARLLAKYQQQIVDAMDQHVSDNLPPNSAISPQALADSRAQLAKNYTLRDLIGKGGDIDLQALAADHRDNPGKYTGNFRTVAQFASDHPEVTGPISDATRIAPPSLMTDVSHINILNPRSWVQPLVGAAGRAGLTRGGPESGLGADLAGTSGGAPGAANAPTPPPSPTPTSANGVPTEGITATALRAPGLGDILTNQRGGAPTDIGGLRRLMNNPQTYPKGPPAEVPKKPAGPFKGNPQTLEDFLRQNLGENF
jgi:hypothetical protein